MNEMAPVNFPGFRSRDPSPAFALPRRSSGSTPRRASASSPPTMAPRRFSSTRPPFTATASAPSARCDQWPEQPSSVASLFAPVPGLFPRRETHRSRAVDDVEASRHPPRRRSHQTVYHRYVRHDRCRRTPPRWTRRPCIREAPGGSAPTREQSHLLFREPAEREITVINCASRVSSDLHRPLPISNRTSPWNTSSRRASPTAA
jgi:hypothetical protein